MIDREKVIQGLRCCTEISGSCIGSDICPYLKCRGCLNTLMKDALELLQEQPQWHPFNPFEPDDTGLKDHYFYLVTVKGFRTPMKAKYHDDLPFGFQPPLTKDFDPCDVVAWCELPDNMDEEVKQDGMC